MAKDSTAAERARRYRERRKLGAGVTERDGGVMMPSVGKAIARIEKRP